MNKTQIINYLKNKGVYTETDHILVDELIANLEIAQMAKADIMENGIKPEGKMMQNPSLHTYNSALKNITTITTKLSLTVQEKTKIKTESKLDDDIENLLDE